MDAVSDEFETWSDPIIRLRVTSLRLLKKPIFDFLFSITRSSVNWIILKLADKMDMDEVLDEFENCTDQIINFRVTSPF